MTNNPFVNDYYSTYKLTGDINYLKNLYNIVGADSFLELFIATGDKHLLKYLIPHFMNDGFHYFIYKTRLFFERPDILNSILSEIHRFMKYFIKTSLLSTEETNELNLLFDREEEKGEFLNRLDDLLGNMVSTDYDNINRELCIFVNKVLKEGVNHLTNIDSFIYDINGMYMVEENLDKANFEKFNIESPTRIYIEKKFNVNHVISQIYEELMRSFSYEVAYAEEMVDSMIHAFNVIINTYPDKNFTEEICTHFNMLTEQIVYLTSVTEMKELLSVFVKYFELDFMKCNPMFYIFMGELISFIKGAVSEFEATTSELIYNSAETSFEDKMTEVIDTIYKNITDDTVFLNTFASYHFALSQPELGILSLCEETGVDLSELMDINDIIVTLVNLTNSKQF